MHLYDVPLAFTLAGLAFYAVLGGADFGAGWWQLTSGSGRRGAAIRDLAHDAMAPVWEANHVWLIFVITVLWTAYPLAFGSIASTLAIPFFIAAVGICLRAAAYVLRSGEWSRREQRAIDTLFSVSSILVPFALGAVVGGIASLRVPAGNAAGDPISSWLNPTSILVGILAVATAAYVAAIFLCADAVRAGEPELESAFRSRALRAGVVTGAIALAGLPVLRSDAHRVYEGLVDGRGTVALVVSIVAGSATLVLVWRRRYEPARLTAALAVASIVAGWALAQAPVLLVDLTIRQAAAPHDTLVVVIVAVIVGAVILFPSLALLFRFVLAGRGAEEAEPEPSGGRGLLAASAPHALARVAGVCLLGGVVFLTVADASWAHAIGVILLLSFVAVGFRVALPPEIG